MADAAPAGQGGGIQTNCTCFDATEPKHGLNDVPAVVPVGTAKMPAGGSLGAFFRRRGGGGAVPEGAGRFTPGPNADPTSGIRESVGFAARLGDARGDTRGDGSGNMHLGNANGGGGGAPACGRGFRRRGGSAAAGWLRARPAFRA
jgi:hypothetical protein